MKKVTLFIIILTTTYTLYSSDNMSKALKHYENMLILDKEILNRKEIDEERQNVNCKHLKYLMEIEKNTFKRIQDKQWKTKRQFFIGKNDKNSTLYGIPKNIINYIFKWALPKPTAYIYSVEPFKKFGNPVREHFKITFYFDLLSDISVTRKLIDISREYFCIKEVNLSKNELVIKKGIDKKKLESQFQSLLNHENNEIANGCVLRKENQKFIFHYTNKL